MSNYAKLVEEFGEEKIELVIDNDLHDICGAISGQALINAKEEVSDDFPELDVFPNDDEFFDTLQLTPKDAAFKAVMGDYNPHHEFVTLDGVENLKSMDENGYLQFIKDADVDIMSTYLDNVKSNSATLSDEIYQAIKEIAKEHS